MNNKPNTQSSKIPQIKLHSRNLSRAVLPILWFIVLSDAYVDIQPVSQPTKTVLRRITRKSPADSAASSEGDTTTIGSLTVPTVGIGTISWSSSKRKFFLRNINATQSVFLIFNARTYAVISIENKELEEVVAYAHGSDAAFFDTAESK